MSWCFSTASCPKAEVVDRSGGHASRTFSSDDRGGVLAAVSATPVKRLKQQMVVLLSRPEGVPRKVADAEARCTTDGEMRRPSSV
jgi:hypothetical protein